MLKYKGLLVLVIILCVVLITTTCAPGNYRWDKTYEFYKPANFWAGLWHGLIIIITFIVNLFTNTVQIYEVNNVGWAYNLGYVLGLMISIGGGFRWTRKRRG